MTWLLVAAAAALAAHTLINARLLRRPGRASTVDEHVALLLPLRDEAGRVEP